MLSPLLVSVGCVDTPAAANVRAWLSAGTTMLPPEALDDKVIFSSEMSTLRGASAYSAAATRWDADAAALLKPYRTSVSRLVPLDGQRVAVRWRAAWDPASLAWAPPLARLLGWEIERFDLDPEVVSNFRWMAIFELFAAALRTRVLRLPAASVEGRAVYCLEEGRCVAHEESLDLVRTVCNLPSICLFPMCLLPEWVRFSRDVLIPARRGRRPIAAASVTAEQRRTSPSSSMSRAVRTGARGAQRECRRVSLHTSAIRVRRAATALRCAAGRSRKSGRRRCGRASCRACQGQVHCISSRARLDARA